jgi:HAD superfamily hydrolase (TIGR01509 family)
MRFIDQFAVVLLDMVHTFMFDADRFSDVNGFAVTYRYGGGKELHDVEVNRILATVFDSMLVDSRNPVYFDRFPSVLSYLEALTVAHNLPASELGLLEQVFALHEVGTVPDTSVEVLQRLRETHRLGVVSDIWSASELYWREFARAGIRELFDVIVFSSDHGHLKPSPYLFLQALKAFPVGWEKIVFVGDSLRRDIAGAKAVGLATVWIDADGSGGEPQGPRPDLIVRDLRDLLDEVK